MISYLTADVPGSGGRLKVEPEDFEVEELPAYAPSGQGEHLFLWIEKRDLPTPVVARQLARGLGIPEREVSYAGLKDKRAVTRQFFSVLSKLEPKLADLQLNGAKILSAKRHGNKLRSGHLHGNRFTLRLREVKDAGAAQAAFARLVEEGFPNFFGPQRFGIHGDNAAQGFLLLRGQRLPSKPDRFQRKLYLSAAQSLLFNEALAERLAARTWRTALPGDVLRKAETGGVFVCEAPATDQPRVDRDEVSPAGPMFGPKMVAARGAVADAEAALLARHQLAASDFLRGGDETQGARRAYRVRMGSPSLTVEAPDTVRVSFELPSGSYATVVLGELIKDSAVEGEDID